jgi:glycosyltransferase involved in cell wall biosynthesis
MKQTIGAPYLPALAMTSEISIALCTYNGAAYLPEQWQSLLQQDRLPDEVIICDDGSTDNTRLLLRQLAADSPFRVEVVENPVRLGFNKNFGQALSRCTGDLVFICDQDDFWMPQKLRLMADFMQQNPAVQVAFNDAEVADEHLQPIGIRFWEKVRFDQQAQQRWRNGDVMDVLLDGNRVMGCATVIRRTFLDKLLPIPDAVPGYIYDGWISLTAASLGVIQFVDEPLQHYRTHPTQQVGVRPNPVGPRIRLRDRFSRDRAIKLDPLRKTQQQLAGIQALLSARIGQRDTAGLRQLNRRLAYYTMRSTLPDNRLGRVIPVLTGLWQGQYHRYADAAADWYSPYLAAMGDMLE